MILSLTDEKNSTKVTDGEKLNYLLKQKLRYIGEFITLTIHVTILTCPILILLYIYTNESLADRVYLMVYPHPGNSGIRQC